MFDLVLLLLFVPGLCFLIFILPRMLTIFREYDIQQDRLKKGQCIQCGYNLTGNQSGTCPECGVKVRITQIEQQSL